MGHEVILATTAPAGPMETRDVGDSVYLAVLRFLKIPRGDTPSFSEAATSIHELEHYGG